MRGFVSSEAVTGQDGGRALKVGNSSGRDIDKFAVLRSHATTDQARWRTAGRRNVSPISNARLIECKVTNTRFINRYSLFILEAIEAWTDPKQKRPKTIHHHGYGTFVVDGETIKLKSSA